MSDSTAVSVTRVVLAIMPCKLTRIDTQTILWKHVERARRSSKQKLMPFCHWTCPLCKGEITLRDNIPGHEALHADFGNKYSIALEKAINGDAKVLDDGKKLKEEAERVDLSRITKRLTVIVTLCSLLYF